MQAHNTEMIVVKEEIQKSLETEIVTYHTMPRGEVPGLVRRQKGQRENMPRASILFSTGRDQGTGQVSVNKFRNR